jgi:hypothetical protein
MKSIAPQYYIGLTLAQYGRVHVSDMKTKFSSVRVYCSFGWYSMFNITHPLIHSYRRYPTWLLWLDMNVANRLFCLVNWAVVPYQKWLYRRVYKRAIELWPEYSHNILEGADYPELLRGLS